MTAGIARSVTLLLAAGLAGPGRTVVFAQDQQPAGRLQVGDPAPPISVERLTNAPMQAPLGWSDLNGKAVVLEFWGTWCGGCIVAVPHLNDLHRRFSPQGVVFLSVTYESDEIVQRFSAHCPINTWIGHDLDRSMITDWAVHEWPTVFVIKDGTILARMFTRELTAEKLAGLLRGGRIERGPAGGTHADFAAPAEVHQDALLRISVRREPPLTPRERAGLRVVVGNNSVRNVVSRLWNVPPYQVTGGDWIDAEMFAVEISGSQNRERMSEAMRNVVSASMGIVVNTRPDAALPGWRLRTAGTGVRLPEGVGEQAGWAVDTDAAGNPVLVGSAMTADDIAMGLSLILGRPLVNETGLRGRYFVHMTLAGTQAELPDLLRERWGLLAIADDIKSPATEVSKAPPPSSR